MSRLRVLLTAAAATLGAVAVHAMTDDGTIPLSERQLAAVRGTSDGNPQKKVNGKVQYTNCADQNDTKGRTASCQGRNNGIDCIYCEETEQQPLIDETVQVETGYLYNNETECSGDIIKSICNDGECQSAGAKSTGDSCANKNLVRHKAQTPPIDP